MSMVAAKERKHLSADALFHLVRSGFANIPAPRCEDVDISLNGYPHVGVRHVLPQSALSPRL